MMKNFSARYSITIPKSGQFQRVRDIMQDDFEISRMEDPFFDPFVRFDNIRHRIDIGYEFDTFFTAFTEPMVFDLLAAELPALKALRVYDAFEDNGQKYVVMPHGATLMRTDGNPHDEKRQQLERAKTLKPRPRLTLPDMPASIDAEGVLPWLMQTHAFIAIGEVHNEHSARTRLNEHTALFGRLGNSHVTLETLRASFQPLLDAYFTNPHRPVPLEIQRWLVSAEKHLQRSSIPFSRPPNAKLTQLLETAKKAGVACCGLSSEICAIPRPMTAENGISRLDTLRMPNWFEERAYLFLASASEIVKGCLEKDPQARIVSLTGHGHSSSYRPGAEAGSAPRIPGLADVFGGVSLHYYDKGCIPPPPKDRHQDIETEAYMEYLRRQYGEDLTRPRKLGIDQLRPHMILRTDPYAFN